MFLKSFNYLNKLFFQYLLIVLIAFLLTILFFKDKESVFLNLSFSNNNIEIENLIDEYLNSDSKKRKYPIKKISLKGSFIYKPLFDRMKNDVANKKEYIYLVNKLNIKFVETCETYNLDCYLEKWNKVEDKYKAEYIKEKLDIWLKSANKRKKIEAELELLGKFTSPYILDFLIKNNNINYKTTKALYKLSNRIKEVKIFEDDLFDNQYLIQEYFNFYHSKNMYFYQESTLTNKIKTIFFTTQFSYWIKSAFSFNFGTINENSIYKLVSKTFLRTLVMVLLVISISYYFTILIILKIKRKKYVFYKFIDKVLHLFAVVHPLMLIVILSIIFNALSLSSKESLIFYIFSLFLTTFLIFLNEVQSIIIREKRKANILALSFYGIKEAVIFKKYIYRDITTQLLKKIKVLIIPISFYTIILEYLFEFNGLGRLFFTSLIDEKYEVLKPVILFIGLTILIVKTYIDIIIFINLKEINKHETNN